MSLKSKSSLLSSLSDPLNPPDIPEELPVMLLSDVVIYPNVIVPLMVDDERMVKLVSDAMATHKMLATFARRYESTGEEIRDKFFNLGTAVLIVKMFRVPDGSIRLLVQGLDRIRMTELVKLEPYLTAKIEVMKKDRRCSAKTQALMRKIVEEFKTMVDQNPTMPGDLKLSVDNIKDPNTLGDLISSNLDLKIDERQQILEIFEIDERLSLISSFLNREIRLLKVGSKIRENVDEELERSQKEYYLREQLRAIRKELGEDDDQVLEISELEKKIISVNMTPEAMESANRELDRLKKMSPASAEYMVSRTYIDWLVNLPWDISTEDNLDIKTAQEILDQDHYGLNDVKERILEFLAVRKIKKDSKGPILCFAGPPGVGKTSLGRSIARAMDRKFIRISLGGVRDEAEIRGHRRTYIGALPGRIIQKIRQAGVRNPIFMLDEIDKIGQDFRGDPSSALLEVLDPEQNFSFSDHYLEVGFDLSKVMFITTANQIYDIPPALRDRMEVITLSGYITQEKVQIAKHFLVPKQLEENGLTKDHLGIGDMALQWIVDRYTREAGVRGLEQKISSICRKTARRVAMGENKSITITTRNLSDYLGVPKYTSHLVSEKGDIGIANGLAWTPVGGDVLMIESTWMPGGKSLKITGQLGSVMQESAEIALSYLRANAAKYRLPEGFFRKNDIHIHVPEGATPKDGPSAGITMVTSLASLFQNVPVRNDIGMTGEITLRGRVLPIGGVREKVVAASRAHLKTVILPSENKKDLEEVPENIRAKLNFLFVDNIDQVLDIALIQMEEAHESVVEKLLEV
jgi:ATP-dependent Lon protease